MTFTELLASLNERLGLELVEEGGATALEIDETTVVLQDTGDGLLLIYADLGEIPVDRKEALAIAALQANFLYQGTGGAALAADSTNAHLHLQRYNWLDRLTAEQAVDALDHFAETATLWKELLTAPVEIPSSAPDASAAIPADDLSLSGNYMRM